MKQRKRTKPLNVRQYSFRVPESVYAQFVEYCDTHLISQSDLIRALLLRVANGDIQSDDLQPSALANDTFTGLWLTQVELDALEYLCGMLKKRPRYVLKLLVCNFHLYLRRPPQ